MKKRIKCLMLCLVLGFSLTTVLACNSKEKEEIKEGSLYKTLLANSKKEIKVKKEIEEETKLTDVERLRKSLYYAERNLTTGEKVLEKYIMELNTRMYLFQLGEVQRRRERVKDIEKKLKNAVEQERKVIKGGKL